MDYGTDEYKNKRKRKRLLYVKWEDGKNEKKMLNS